MKKQLLFGVFAFLALNTFSQNQTQTKNSLVPVSANALETLTKPSRTIGASPKSILCQDTIRYPQIKEQLLNGTASFSSFSLWTADAEYMSQTYLHTGGTITIPKIEFYGNVDENSTASVTVEGSIYNVNGANVPTTLISSGTMTLSSATAGYFYITLSTPAVVTGNYAVVIRPTSAAGVVEILVNNPLTGQVQDEGLSKIRSSYYPNSAGAWVSVPVMTNDAVNFNATYDFEPLISPIVSYAINTTATVVTSPACLGTAVQFNNSTTPAGIINNRMYNYQKFRSFFGLAVADSTHVWDLDNLSPLVWSSTTNYTYPAVGTYDATLFTLGGFWSSCTDFSVAQVIINPAGNSSFNYSAANYCQGSANQTPTTSQAGTFSATPSGLNFVSTTSGQINLATSAANTYTVSYTTTGPCPTTSTQTVTINPAANSNFAYSGSTFCSGSSNQTPTISSPGTFSATPAGLVFANSTTGEIDMVASANNTYTISFTASGACASTSTQSLTITNAPTGGFSYAQTSYCSNDANQLPVFTAGASGGIFSSTPAGLTISAAGQITTATSLAGTYIVTNTISGGGCPVVTETATVTINSAPVVTMAAISDVCASDASFTLTGGTPALGVYSGVGVTAGVFSPATATAGVHPVTYTFIDANNCQASAVQSITVNALPIVTLGAFPSTLCAGDAAIALPIGSPAGGIYSGTGVSGVNFDPSVSGIGTFVITYTYQNAQGCQAAAVKSVIVNALPNVTFAALNNACINNTPFTLTGGSPAGGSFAGPGVAAGGIFNPSVAGIGTHTITYSVTTGGCNGTATQTIVVDGCASIEEISGVNASVFPNPTNDELNIIINNANIETLTVSLVSTDGKEVLSTVVNQENVTIQLQVSEFPSGVYFLSINSDSGKMIQKIVIQ